MGMPTRLWFAGTLTALSIVASPARSETKAESEAAAQTLYDEATAEMDAHRYDAACPKLEEVTRLVPEGLGARLTLAQCYEGVGKLASAWTQYAMVAPRAKRAGQSARANSAEAKMAELAPHVAKLTLEIERATREIADLQITRDGIEAGPSQWGVAIPIDRGPHVIVASAPGRVALRREIVVDDGAASTVEVGPLAAVVGPLAGPLAKPERLPPPTPAQRNWQAPMGFVVGGLGIASAGIGFVLGGLAIGKAGDASGECDQNLTCTARGMSLRKEGRILADTSTGLLVVGGVSTATGIVLVATAPTSKSVRARAAVGAGAVLVTGEF